MISYCYLAIWSLLMPNTHTCFVYSLLNHNNFNIFYYCWIAWLVHWQTGISYISYRKISLHTIMYIANISIQILNHQRYKWPRLLCQSCTMHTCASVGKHRFSHAKHVNSEHWRSSHLQIISFFSYSSQNDFCLWTIRDERSMLQMEPVQQHTGTHTHTRSHTELDFNSI